MFPLETRSILVKPLLRRRFVKNSLAAFSGGIWVTILSWKTINVWYAHDQFLNWKRKKETNKQWKTYEKLTCRFSHRLWQKETPSGPKPRYMMFATPMEEYKVNPVAARAINAFMILHMDHVTCLWILVALFQKMRTDAYNGPLGDFEGAVWKWKDGNILLITEYTTCLAGLGALPSSLIHWENLRRQHKCIQMLKTKM